MRMFKKVEDVLVIRCAVKMFIKIILIFVVFNCGVLITSENTGLVKETEDQLLLLSTLDGFFICIERRTGLVRWKLKEEPVIRLPTNLDKSVTPFFLPDPTDGSLYLLNSNDRDALSKLPFTIPQLVASSPCRSSDGIIFTGKKLDTWFSVNPESGVKRSFLTYNSIDLTCSKEGPDIYIGRTEYNVVMVDTLKKERAWNVTFYDYLSYTMDTESKNKYNLLHFTGSSSGRIITLDKETGSLIWQLNCESPVIDIYILETRGLLKVPFTSVSEPTLDQLIHDSNQRKNSDFGMEFKTSELKFFPTLYIGKCISGLYALPALVDENTATIALARRGPLLLEGPHQSFPDENEADGEVDGEKQTDSKNSFFKIKDLHFVFSNGTDDSGKGKSSVILLGHYKVPEYTKAVLQIEGKSEVRKIIENESSVFDKKISDARIQTENENYLKKLRLYDAVSELVSGNATIPLLKEIISLSFSLVKFYVGEQENLEIKMAMLGLLIIVFSLAWYFNKQMKDIQQLSQSSKNRDSNLSAGVTAVLEELGFGVVKVGKIEFNAEEILGKGCEGTFVFKGKFDNRSVAVKRVLPECFTFANREVELLRESDYHPNVVRYYCMEQDKQFRYIALELCAATLQDYIEGKFVAENISAIEILQQATCGLKHLHYLSIVHRDIKPHNVLLSISPTKRDVRVMISDFGLCKKLNLGRTSFSRRSGVTGTDGWIAPEMLTNENRTTCAVDIFSMGCVFCYVLTKGKHPFGDTLHRQANILSGNYDLSSLEDDHLSMLLIRYMIAFDPLNRPTASAILENPFFWSKSKILSFFQDVSDRIEKEDAENFVVQNLEKNGSYVVRKDWRFCIDSEVAKDLRKFRNYHGDRVRELLRALRNKKHHYRELSEKAQKNLGEIPEDFVSYWTKRFPLLLIHAWIAMQCVKTEPVFSIYYDSDYDFPNLTEEDYIKYEFDWEGFLDDDDKELFMLESTDLLEKGKAEGSNGKIKPLEECISELKSSSLDFKNVWFQKWLKSDFKDEEAFVNWRECESNSKKTGKDCSDKFNVPESVTWQLREKFRSLVLESQQVFNAHSPKKSKPKKYYQKKFNNKKSEAKKPVSTLNS